MKSGHELIQKKRFKNFQLSIIGSNEIREWRSSSKITSDHVDERTRSSKDARACQGLAKRVSISFVFGEPENGPLKRPLRHEKRRSFLISLTNINDSCGLKQKR
jgi:hypothetical protein